jgi:ornithine cyclodeaminase/alanine dehydrogenase-like protein (mu-crystallin family)
LVGLQAIRYKEAMGNDAIVIGYDRVLGSVSPGKAIDRVRQAFIRYAKGEWTMPPKIYLQSPPGGDFRAMPALGDGLAMLKWVTSFPANRARGLPTVTGAILVSDAATGLWRALIDGRAVTALRTGAAGMCADADPAAARALAEELGWRAVGRREALGADVVTLVTPGRRPVVTASDLHPGLHINALGADGPGKAEMTVDAVTRCELVCDEWAQASHGGELTGAVESGLVHRDQVTELGDILVGTAEGRGSPHAVTLFDSTGLAIQDLAIATVLLEEHAAGRLEAETVSL